MDELEYIKLCVLCNTDPMSDINVNEVVNLLDTQMPVSEIVLSCQKDLVYRFVKANDRQPTIEEMRQIQSSAYALSVG